MNLSKDEIKNRKKRWEIKKKSGVVEKIGTNNKRLQAVLNTLPTQEAKEIQSCYLYGDVGTGKTVKAALLLLQGLQYRFINGFRQDFIFATVPEFLQELKNTFENKELSEEFVLDKYKKVAFLVLDDIGVQKTTDWTFLALYTLIGYRYDNLLPTIYTSNLSLDELGKGLGDDRIPSRIEHACGENLYKFNNKSLRQK